MQKSKYKFGITTVKYISNERKTVAVCTCGQHTILQNYWDSAPQCVSCGNEYFLDKRNIDVRRFILPFLNVERKDNRGFKITRVNLSVSYQEGFLTVIKENLKRTMEYDIVDGTLQTFRNDVLEYSNDGNFNNTQREYANRMFFTGLPQSEFLEAVSNEVTRNLYKTVVRSLSDNGYYKSDDTLKGLELLASEDYKWLQILSNAGVADVSRFYERSGRYHRTRNEGSAIDITATRPHEILRIPKFMMAYIREDLTINRWVLTQLQGYFKVADHNKFKEILSIVKDESNIKALADSIDTITQIHIDYEYTNLKKLALYIFRECRLTQGIDSPQNASNYLKDYISMSRAMGLEYEKYPKSLKKVHDVVQMNYKMVKNETDTGIAFLRSIDKKSYKDLAFKKRNKRYAVITPTKSEDLVKEGNQLSHCVASYVKDVINDKCKILFLREAENPDTPLATIEVRGINIRQARGFGNRQLTKDEKEFVKEWAEEKGLNEAYY